MLSLLLDKIEKYLTEITIPMKNEKVIIIKIKELNFFIGMNNILFKKKIIAGR
ncbi:unnamed protein product [marine sediment metagenome]|uniref:Uncharacterized protein n=1 Tax=marine sediment metagenome TaxID=412755 RepID=X1B3A3_9ZZZZ